MKKYIIISIGLFALVLLSTCRKRSRPFGQYTVEATHHLWDSLLHKYVNHQGLVDYEKFVRDSTSLNTYIAYMESNIPNASWSSDSQLAYWINLYNAATVKLIITHYPVASIKDIGSSIQIPFINTPWQIEFIRLNGDMVDLDDIEHRIIREYFDEPRVHFALVCGAISCPKLRNEAYTGLYLNEQLTDQAEAFLADPDKNNITKKRIKISKIFRWYSGDFKKKRTLVDFINQYSAVSISPEAEVEYMDYSWQLNEQ